MDKVEYDADPTYRKLKKDPTTKLEKKITDALKVLERKGDITTNQRKYLAPQYSSPPQLYGTPKIHKEGIPLRPIVSSIDSPTYRLAKHLAKILAPLSGNTESSIQNSADFVNRLKDIDMRQGDKMVSFDVVNLFTRVPLDDSLQIISHRLIHDETLDTCSTIPAHEICSLIELCMRCTYFQYRDTFYEQLDRVAMGSPLSPVIANIFMESFENDALSSFR